MTQLLYGKTGLELDLSAFTPTVIEKRAMPVLVDPQAAVNRALAQPVNVPTLEQIAAKKRSACILICDITRPVPNGLFLPLVVQKLIAAGIPKAKISIVVATGLHRPNEGAELAELIGNDWVLANVKIFNHDALNDAEHVDLGLTSKGTRVKLDRRFVEADLKIATGLVEPHFMAGYSGGRKVVAPGVAHAETITTFHNSSFMAHPRAANCILDGNPLHEEQLEIIEKLGGALALNTVIDDKRRLAFVNFGEIISSHLEAVAFIRNYAEVAVGQRFKTVLTSAAGYPLDKTYYQTVKGMVGPLDILEPGGDLIILSECSEGLGSKHYRDAQRRLVSLGVDGFMQEIEQKRHANIDEWQTQMQLKPMRLGNVFLYSDKLSDADKALTGVSCIDSAEQTVLESVHRQGSSSIAVIPEGPYVVPFKQ